MEQAERRRNIERLLTPFDCQIARDSEAGSGPEQCVLIFASLWMHLRGFSASDAVAAHRALVASSQTDSEIHNRWVSVFRSKGLPDQLASLELGVLFEAAAAVVHWTDGRSEIEASGLPLELAQLWERGQRCARSSPDFASHLARIRADPRVEEAISRIDAKCRADEYLGHFGDARDVLFSLATKSSRALPTDATFEEIAADLLQIELLGLGEPDIVREFPQVVRTARQVAFVDHFVRMGWAELNEVAPEFFWERLVTGGIRIFRYGTGDMTAVAIFAESHDQVTRWVRFCREPQSIAHRFEGTRLELMPVLYLHAGDKHPVLAPTSFELTSSADRADLVRAIVQGGMRLEVFTEVDGLIRAIEVGFIPLQSEITVQLHEALKPYEGCICESERYLAERMPPLSEELQARADGSEFARFELLFELSILPSRLHTEQGKRDALRAASRRFLSDLHSESSTSSGVALDSRSAYFDALADTGRPPRPRLQPLLSDPDLILHHRWVLYIDVRNNHIDFVAAGLDEAGGAQFEELSIELTPASEACFGRFDSGLRSSEWMTRADAVAHLGSWLASATADLAKVLAERGVNEVLVCSGHSLQWLPLHIAEPWVGLVSGYVPALAFCQSWTEELLPEGIEVHSGSASDLALLAQEVSTIRAVSSNRIAHPDFLAPRSRHVHFAGHAVGGGAAHQRGLQLDATDVTVPTILAQADFIGVELATLSGCSTGSFDQVSAGPQELGGVDFALLARGAKCVVSTMWNVHDSASALFMVALHADLTGGLSIRKSYANAQALLRTGTTSANAAMTLQEHWPTWRDDVAIDTSLQVHWGAFRIVGRYWQ